MCSFFSIKKKFMSRIRTNHLWNQLDMHHERNRSMLTFRNHSKLRMYKSQKLILWNFSNEYWQISCMQIYVNKIQIKVNYLDRNSLSLTINRRRSIGLLYLYQVNWTGYDDLTWHSSTILRLSVTVRFFNVFTHWIFVDWVLRNE